MFRALIGFLASLAILLAPAAAGDIVDTQNAFRFTVPDGWKTETPPLPTLAIVVVSPQRAETGGNCNVVTVRDESTRSMTQSEIEARLSAEINEQFWKGMLGTIDGAKSSKLEKWGDKMQRGRKVFFIRSTTEFSMSGVNFTVTQIADMHVIPGRAYFMTCSAFAAQFEREASGFDTIMASFEPVSDTFLTVRGPAPWVATNAGHARTLIRAGGDALKAGVPRPRPR